MQGAVERIEIQRRKPARAKGGKKTSGTKGQAKLLFNEKEGTRSILHRWSAAGLILLGAILAVLFVANAIYVNELLRGVTSVEAERDAIKRENEQLRAELTRLMSVEEITGRAEEIGMIQPQRPPTGLVLKNKNLPINR